MLALICLSGFVVWSTDAFYSFLLRGTEANEIYQLNGRLFLWAAAFAENTWQTIVLGNGYLMNSPNGLEFYVPGMGRNMESPHSGYISILLGSGVIGAILVALMYLTYVRNVLKMKKWSELQMKNSLIFVFLFLADVTIMDYGAWGVTSPSMLVFSLIYLSTFGIISRERV